MLKPGLHSVSLVFAVLCSVACSGSPEFADWTIPVPEGTDIVEHASVPDAERSEPIGLERDLVIGDRDDENYSFYNVVYFDLDDAGNLYVLDAGNHRVMVYDDDGGFVRKFGREGQGPGEFMRPRGFAVVGDRIVVEDADLARMSVFDLDGDLMTESSLQTGFSFLHGSGLPGGDIVIMKQEVVSPELRMSGPARLLRISREGEEIHSYARAPHTLMAQAGKLGKRPLLFTGGPSFAVDDDGSIYFTAGEEYQIHEFAPSGEMVSALRVAHERPPYPQETIDAMLERARENRPDTTARDYFIPDRQPALTSITVDGHGHLWVFPWVDPSFLLLDTDHPEWRPADVYGQDGTRLFSGFISGEMLHGWHRARGDHVYVSQSDPASREWVIARYRLVEPFE